MHGVGFSRMQELSVYRSMRPDFPVRCAWLREMTWCRWLDCLTLIVACFLFAAASPVLPLFGAASLQTYVSAIVPTV